MFGLMYVVLTAKKVSIRRLCLLYAFLLASARCLLGGLHVEHAASLALAIATAVTLLVWVAPLVRVLFGAVFGRRIPLEVFETVSACVQFTYGFTLVMLPVIALETGLTVPHAPMQAALIPAIAWGCVGGGGFVMMIQAFVGTTRATKVRGTGYLAQCNQIATNGRTINWCRRLSLSLSCRIRGFDAGGKCPGAIEHMRLCPLEMTFEHPAGLWDVTSQRT